MCVAFDLSIFFMSNVIHSNEHTPADIRCTFCSKVLAPSNEKGNSIEIKCRRCGNFDTILHQSRSQIVFTDIHGEILFVNGETKYITGYNPHEIIGKTSVPWGGHMPKKFYEGMWRTLLGEKKPVSTKIINRHKLGQLYQAQLVISPIFDSSHNVLFFVGVESFIRKL